MNFKPFALLTNHRVMISVNIVGSIVLLLCICAVTLLNTACTPDYAYETGDQIDGYMPSDGYARAGLKTLLLVGCLTGMLIGGLNCAYSVIHYTKSKRDPNEDT